jgi:hypothetical protein
MRFIATLSLCLFTMRIHAQECRCPDIPTENTWTTAAQYKRDLENVKKILQWLICCPLESEITRRSEANAFVLEWISGSPWVHVEVNSSDLPFTNDFPDLLFTYIHGYALKALETKQKQSHDVYCEAGYNAVAQLTHTDTFKKNERIEELHKAVKRNRLTDYMISVRQKH